MKRDDDLGPPYMVRYNHNGNTYAFTFGADDWDEAQARLRSIGFNGEVVASGVQTYRTNALTLPLIAFWVPFTCWLRNLFRRQP